MSPTRVALVSPPIHAPVNEIGHGYMPPLGLLAVAAPLVRAGHEVELIDADAAHLTHAQVVERLEQRHPAAVLVGHSGSAAANPSALALIRSVKAAMPRVHTVYGGVWPTFTHQRIMAAEPAVDLIVRGEGEPVIAQLFEALTRGGDLSGIAGLVWRSDGRVLANPGRPAPLERDLPIPWHLVDWPRYRCLHNDGRSAVVQFSRGCPNRCAHCGQWRFWRQWRHRRVHDFVDELTELRERYDVRSAWIADENWSHDPDLFRALIQALADRDLGIELHCAMCAEHVVRDEAWLDLYRRAGVLCVMMGVESLDREVLARVGKQRSEATTRRAVELLREHGMVSIVNVIYGLRDETWPALARTSLALRSIGPDFVNALHLTPLPWTREGRTLPPGRIALHDQRYWDFRHPVVRPRLMSPRALGLGVKLSEVAVHLRPIRLIRRMLTGDRRVRRLLRRAMPRLARVFLRDAVSLVRALRALEPPGARALAQGDPSPADRARHRAPLTDRGATTAPGK